MKTFTPFAFIATIAFVSTMPSVRAAECTDEEVTKLSADPSFKSMQAACAKYVDIDLKDPKLADRLKALCADTACLGAAKSIDWPTCTVDGNKLSATVDTFKDMCEKDVASDPSKLDEAVNAGISSGALVAPNATLDAGASSNFGALGDDDEDDGSHTGSTAGKKKSKTDVDVSQNSTGTKVPEKQVSNANGIVMSTVSVFLTVFAVVIMN